MNLKDNSISGIYKDKLINFYFFKYFDDTIYFYKNDDPANELYSMSLKILNRKRQSMLLPIKINEETLCIIAKTINLS